MIGIFLHLSALDVSNIKYSPAKGAKEKVISLSDFEINKTCDIVSCPQGHVPVKRKTKKIRHSIAFDSQKCFTCHFQKTCPVKQSKKYYYLRYTDKAMRLAQRRVYEKTDEFKIPYRWRARVEATMSEYDRRTGVKHLRVRGLKAVRFPANLKTVGLNIFRATAVPLCQYKLDTYPLR